MDFFYIFSHPEFFAFVENFPVIFPNKESYKENPDEDFEIWALDIGGMEITFDEKSVELEYIARSYDIMWYYKQEFDRAKGKWEKVDEDEVGCMTSETY